MKKQAFTALKAHFKEEHQLKLDDLRAFFRKNDPSLSDATIRWRVHNLIQEGVLSRTGHGVYQLARQKEYLPELSARVKKINKFITRNYPTAAYCTWDSGMINEFAQHISGYTFILVDIERDVAESSYHRLKEEFKGIFYRPSETLINDVLPDFQLPIIVRHLITESPLNKVENMVTVSLEKLLADVFCDVEFQFLAGAERRSIFNNAYYKYTVNENKLLRYAARKGRRADLEKYLKEGNFTTIHI